jgi:BON domain
MIEPLFASSFPNWPVAPSPGFGWSPISSAISHQPLGSSAMGISTSPISTPGVATGLGGSQIVNTLPPSSQLLMQVGPTETYGAAGGLGVSPQSAAAWPGLAYAFPTIPGGLGMPGSFPGFIAPEFPAGNRIPALLATVAIRRGQPLGPTNDQEVEDFVYDALEFLPGTSEVEVRCEGGRVTFTGSLQYKRLKRDIGEIAWAIPAVNDVQNNLTINMRRRGRVGGREGEPQVSQQGRKPA